MGTFVPHSEPSSSESGQPGGCSQLTLPDVNVVAHADLGLGTCDGLGANVVGQVNTDHVLPDVGAAIGAHVDGLTGNEYECGHSTAIAAQADLWLDLGSCDHGAGHDLATVNVDAHLGDLSCDHLHVAIA
jgi:hypothetical protein